MKPVNAAEVTAWMASTGDFWTGHDPRGWEAATWVLHAMHEDDPEEVPDTLRIRWADLAHEYDLTWPEGYQPGHTSLPSELTMPLYGPSEGEMDELTRHAVLDVVAHEVAWETPCLFHWSTVNTHDWSDDAGVAYQGLLSDAPDLWKFDPETTYRGAPSNIWPLDRSWMIYTGADSWGTRVSGPLALILALEAEADLECVRCPEPGVQAGTSVAPA